MQVAPEGHAGRTQPSCTLRETTNLLYAARLLSARVGGFLQCTPTLRKTTKLVYLDSYLLVYGCTFQVDGQRERNSPENHKASSQRELLQFPTLRKTTKLVFAVALPCYNTANEYYQAPQRPYTQNAQSLLGFGDSFGTHCS